MPYRVCMELCFVGLYGTFLLEDSSSPKSEPNRTGVLSSLLVRPVNKSHSIGETRDLVLLGDD